MGTLFLGIFLLDVLLLCIGDEIGEWSINKESKDNWNGEKYMEARKSQRLADTWSKKHPILDWFQGFHYDVGRALEKPGNIYREIKWFIQRGKRGYSDCNVWGFYDYLTDVMIGGLKDLQGMVHGYPGGFANSHALDTDGESKGTKEWKKIIGEIIWTFEVNKKLEDHDWIIVKKEKDREELKKFERRLNRRTNKKDGLFSDLPPHKWHLMTKKEMKRYKQGWKYFQEYYFDLWD